MAQSATPSFTRVQNELAQVIRSVRSDCIPHETARQLLAYDYPGYTTLVGIDYAGERAILYHEHDRYAIAVRFGPDGLADGGARIAMFRDGPGLETWIAKLGCYWGWIHPRYRG